MSGTKPGIGVSCSTRAAAIGSSMSASGLPAASRRIRVRVVGVSCLADASSSAAALAGSSALSRCSGSPASTSDDGNPSRAGGQEQDRVGLQATGDEREHVRRRAIEPVGILGDDQQRRVGGDLGEQIEDRHRDAEVLGRSVVSEAERSVEHGAVSGEQAGCVVTHRAQELVQTRERDVGLGLHPRRSQHRDVAFARERRRLRQQAGLADPRLAAQHERAAAAFDPIQQRRQQLRLGVSAEEWPSVIARHGEHGTATLPQAQCLRDSIALPQARPNDAAGPGDLVRQLGARHPQLLFELPAHIHQRVLRDDVECSEQF